MLILIASRLVLLLLRCFIRTFFVRRVFGIALLLCRCVMGLLCDMRASSEIISKMEAPKLTTATAVIASMLPTIIEMRSILKSSLLIDDAKYPLGFRSFFVKISIKPNSFLLLYSNCITRLSFWQ